MSTGLQTVVDSLSIADGVWQEKASNLGIIEQSRLIPTWHGRGNLYVLVETIGSFPDPAQIQERVIGIVSEYYGSPGSVTAGLRLAIKSANSYLFEENLNAPREQRGVVGVTCVVLKDRDAYIGQCGPAVLYHVGKGQFQRLPKESTWLTSQTLQDVDISRHPPLGLRREIEPDLFHLYIRDGDVLILATTSLAKVASDEDIARGTLERGAHEVCDSLESLAGGQDVSIIAVELASAEAPVEATAGEIAGGAAARPVRRGLWDRVSSRVRGALAPSPPAEEAPEEAMEEPEEEAERFPARLDLKASAASVWRSLTRLARELAALVARILPEAEPRGPAHGARRRREATAASLDRRWLYAALLIPVFVVFLVAVTRFQHQRTRETQFRQLMEQVEQAKTAAEVTSIVAEQRAVLTQALETLDQALAMKPGNKQALTEKSEIDAWLDRINHVVRVPYLIDLEEFPDTETAQTELRRVFVHGIDIYVLDLGTDRVYKYLLNETRDGLQALEGDHVLLRKGDQRGQITVGELLDIAWVEAGGLRGINSLLIVDRQGHLIEYDPLVALAPLAIMDSGVWVQPAGMVGYYGRLYILDPQANRLLRYILTNEGYEGSHSDYFSAESGANIRNAVDAAIDGNVYILHSDGAISKYQEGQRVDFSQASLDRPLQSPCCIFATGFMDEDGYVYVADAGNQRIVQFSKAGEFIRQFVSSEATPMDALRGLYVDEAENQLFVLNGSKLQLLGIPE